MSNFINRYKYFLLLLLVELVLFFTNYKLGTYLVGWDNLYPELNFSANFQRSIFAIWQEYRGLGVIDGMAHAANLPHTIFIFLLSFILPQNLLRYFFIFFLHFLGGIGVYLLLKKLFTSNHQFLSLLGALFYQFNLATVQMFYAPLEVFAFHFAFLPILIYLVWQFLDTGSKKYFLWFGLFSFFSLPQAHVPSVFLVYLLTVVAFLLFSIFREEKRTRIKRGLVILLIIFLINAFWGLPYIYTTFNASRTIINSKINQMSTENVVDRNKAFGNFTNVALLRGFPLDYVDFQPNGQNNYMMLAWRNHINKPLVYFISLVIFLLTLYGTVKVLIKKDVSFYPFIGLFALSFSMLGNDIWGISLVYRLFQTRIPLFYEVFRFTFTKFSILYALSYTILLTYALHEIVNSLARRQIILCTFVLSAGLLIYSFPAFNGNFLYYNLRVKIPTDYFALIHFFKQQSPQARIATLPQPSYWGWVYYQWGVRGSGFIWYGLSQATLDGAFYPWSRENENYYWEITQAVYSENREVLEKIFDKYQINWLIVDSNIISPFSPKAIFTDKLEEMIKNSRKLKETVNFGKIKVYKVNLNTSPKDFVFLAENLPMVGPTYRWNNLDKAYLDYGNYVSGSSTVGGVMASQVQPATPEVSLWHIYYPFRSLFTGRQQNELEFGIEEKGNYFSLTTKISRELVGYKLVIPELEEKEIAQIDENDLDKKTIKSPEIYLDGEFIQIPPPQGSPSAAPGVSLTLPYIREGNLKVRVPKIKGYYSFAADPVLMNLEPKSCDQFNKGIYKHEFTTDPTVGEDLLRLTSVGSSNCLDFDLPNLSQDIGYLVTVQNRNIEGKSLLFSVINRNSQRADVETYLPKFNSKSSTIGGAPSGHPRGVLTAYFIIPPMEQYGLGYTLHLDNISIGRVKTVNDLGRITVNPIPYRFLTSLKIVKDTTLQGSTLNGDIKVDHPNPSLYKVIFDPSTIGGVMASQLQPATPEVSLSPSNNTTLVLSQSFDSGWHAYSINNQQSTITNYLFPFFFGQELKNHVLVNNWENGWHLQPTTHNPQPTTIIIVYLPQYLEYIGFILLGAAFLVVIFYPNSPILNPRDGKS